MFGRVATHKINSYKRFFNGSRKYCTSTGSNNPYFLNRFSHNYLNVTLSKRYENDSDTIRIMPFTKKIHSAQINDLKPESGAVHLNYAGGDSIERQLLYELENNYTEAKLRNVLCKIFESYRKLHVNKAVIHLEDFLIKKKDETEENLVKAITKVANLMFYSFDKYKKKKRKHTPKEIQIVLSSNSSNQQGLESVVKETLLVTNGTLFARDLGNERSDIANPDFIEGIAKSIFEKYSSDVNLTYKSICGVEELSKNQLHLIAGVGQGSRYSPRLIMINYKGNPDSNESVALVGKGITFDTGGLNLKPTGSIENMHLDMCGSAAVLGTLYLALETKLKQNITAVLAVAENAIDANSYKPYCIIQSHNGLTVEVGNTDAEGRLVLADALSYTQQEYNPTTIIDMATLTGACVVALGEYAAGLFSNDPALTQEIQTASANTFERCWPLPLFPEHTEEIKSVYADIKSTGKGRNGGASIGAAFLNKFINKGVNWAHVDIAGPAMLSEKSHYFPKGGTGFGVELLFNFLKSRQGAK